MPELIELIDVIETWQIQRTALFNTPGMQYNDGSNYASMQKFLQIQDAMTKRLISVCGKQDPEFYSAMYELAQNTDRIIRGGKTFINGQQQI